MSSDSTMVRRPQPLRVAGKSNACLIVLSGELTGRIYKLTQGKYMLGRSEEAHIKLSDDGISRLHAEVMRYDDGLYVLKDLDSTNGTYINGTRIKSRALNDGDRIQVGSVTILKFTLQDSLEDEVQEKLYQYATRDPLTHAHNRRFFEEQLSKDFSHALRREQPLSLLMLDLDYFKRINDTHGHPVGDHVLSELGQRMLHAVRNEDVLCRIGGEEFAVILRDTSRHSAHRLALRLLRLISERPIDAKGTILNVTASIGVAAFDKAAHTCADDLVAEADRYLYDAKYSGRNCVRPEML